MNMVAFDIETGPRPDDELANLKPVFDPASVKLGNTKDPDKINARIDEARERHDSDWTTKAALSPYTGKILAIGFQELGGDVEIAHGNDEAEVIHTFLQKIRMNVSSLFVGHYIFEFDLPFIITRAIHHHMTLPMCLLPNSIGGNGPIRGRGHFGDTYEWAKMGSRNEPGRSLDFLARFYGVGSKDKTTQIIEP